MAAIFVKYADEGMEELKPITRENYEYFLFGILTHTFGHLLPQEILPFHIAQYREKRKKEKAAIAGNRECSTLSAVFEFAMRNGLAKSNPCRGSRRNREKPSRVEISTEMLAAGVAKAPPHYARILEFGYLTGVRREDIILLKTGAIEANGIDFTESKTGKPVNIS